MEGVLTVKETRENVQSMEKWRNDAAKEVAAQNNVGVLNTVIDITKITCMVVGAVATVVAGVVATPAASPVVAKAAFAVSGALDGARMLLNGQSRDEGMQKISAALTNINGETKDVSVKDNDIAKPQNMTQMNQTANIRTNTQSIDMVK